jgi:hypothetical protein
MNTGSNRFALLGFPNETNEPRSNVVYQCFVHNARIALWERRALKGYALNLYRAIPDSRMLNDTLTDVRDRYHVSQGPIEVADAFEAQLAINYLIQTYLPREVTGDIDGADITSDVA